MKPANVAVSPNSGERSSPPVPLAPAKPVFLYTDRSSTTMMESRGTQGYTYLDTVWADQKSKSSAMLFLKGVLVTVTLLLIMAVCVAFIIYYHQGESSDDDDFSKMDLITELDVSVPTTSNAPVIKDTSTTRRPTTASTAPTTTTTTTTTKPKTMICTVSETLRIEDSITEGICDYAVFSDLAVVRGDLKPVQGKHAWEVFKRAVAISQKTIGGVSFSSHLATQQEGTLLQLLSIDTSRLEELIVTQKMIALGTLGLSRDSAPVVNIFLKTFEYLRAALEDRPGSITFLGAWIITAHDARSFASSLGKAQDIDFVIIQTHITMTALKGPCRAHMISQADEGDEVPNFSVAKEVMTRLRGHAIGSPRLMLSSTMAVMGYSGAKGGPSVNFDRRECERTFVVDIDAVCRSTLGDLRRNYVKRDMSTYISFKQYGIGYMFTFESKESLRDKAKEFANLTDGWAFFDVHRDIYWPCRSGRAYERLKLGISEMRLPTTL